MKTPVEVFVYVLGDESHRGTGMGRRRRLTTNSLGVSFVPTLSHFHAASVSAVYVSLVYENQVNGIPNARSNAVDNGNTSPNPLQSDPHR